MLTFTKFETYSASVVKSKVGNFGGINPFIPPSLNVTNKSPTTLVVQIEHSVGVLCVCPDNNANEMTDMFGAVVHLWSHSMGSYLSRDSINRLDAIFKGCLLSDGN